MSKFKDLKVGQDVYIVHQRDRRQIRNNKEPKTEWLPVTKVGRKYGYVNLHGSIPAPFCLQTGKSIHDPNHNARANGLGFDVYRTGYEYSEVLYLNKRRELVDTKIREVAHLWGSAPLEICDKLLEVLEKWEVERKPNE